MLLEWFTEWAGEAVAQGVSWLVDRFGLVLALPLDLIVWMGRWGQIGGQLFIGLSAITVLFFVVLMFGVWLQCLAAGAWHGTKSLLALFGIAKLWFDSRTRRNHALEHATLNILRERGLTRYGPSLGVSGPTGFWLVWDEPSEKAEEKDLARLYLKAALEAAARLRAGEWRLAFSPTCGTSHIVISTLLFFGFWALLWASRGDLFDTFLGLWLMALLAPILGWEMQRITLTARIGDLQPIAAQEAGHVFIRTVAEGREVPCTLPPVADVPGLISGSPLRPGDPVPRGWWELPLAWWRHEKRIRRMVRERKHLERTQPDRFWAGGMRIVRVTELAKPRATREVRPETQPGTRGDRPAGGLRGDGTADRTDGREERPGTARRHRSHGRRFVRPRRPRRSRID
ncbi:DUF6391 domain-containing protein [Thermaerobacter litoralis]